MYDTFDISNDFIDGKFLSKNFIGNSLLTFIGDIPRTMGIFNLIFVKFLIRLCQHKSWRVTNYTRFLVFKLCFS